MSVRCVRELLEGRERQCLAPFALLSQDSRGRRHPEPEDPYRTAYQRDRDRIIHCTAFRRLEYKTQVFVYHEGDYYRTRLTHSIEVSQVARSLAVALGLNEGFVEALSLAHDLGHPPFGHKGGEALHDLMRDHGGFEHNVQGLRIVDLLERRYPAFPGLNLSFELREAILKHGPTGTAAGTAEFTPFRPPLLETVVVDLADSTAYNHHDLDDGLRSGLIRLDGQDGLAPAVPLVADCLAEARHEAPSAPGREIRLLTINKLVKKSILDLIRTSAARLAESGARTAEEARDQRGLIAFSPAMTAGQRELQRYLMANFYHHPRVMGMMERAREIVVALFHEYTSRPELLPDDYRRRAEADGVHRSACDYLAGMTDRFAEEEMRKLGGGNAFPQAPGGPR